MFVMSSLCYTPGDMWSCVLTFTCWILWLVTNKACGYRVDQNHVCSNTADVREEREGYWGARGAGEVWLSFWPVSTECIKAVLFILEVVRIIRKHSLSAPGWPVSSCNNSQGPKQPTMEAWPTLHSKHQATVTWNKLVRENLATEQKRNPKIRSCDPKSSGYCDHLRSKPKNGRYFSVYLCNPFR